MRIKSIYISSYKNIQELNVDFDGESFIEMFVGRNGSGKSNFFEAIFDVLRHIYEFGSSGGHEVYYDYRLVYEIDSVVVDIEFKGGKLTENGELAGKSISVPIPDHVLVYYSGHNNSVSETLESYAHTFSAALKNANADDARRFIGVGNSYKDLMITILLLQADGNVAKEYLIERLGIKSISDEIRVILKRPDYAQGNTKFDVAANEGEGRYWSPKGITRKFLDALDGCIQTADGESIRTEGYLSSEDKYSLYIGVEALRNTFSDLSAEDLFKRFDNLMVLGMLESISLPVEFERNSGGSLSDLSDGQIQSVYIYAISELFKTSNCVVLMDEPDAFLHPEWQLDFLKHINDINSQARESNHFLISTHSAATVCSLEGNAVNVFEAYEARVTVGQETKKKAVSSLSGGGITYSEDESKLLLDNVVRQSDKPILFVEGISDVSVLNTAYKKLYPDRDMPILVQDAFDRGFMKVMISRDDLTRRHPNKTFFSLFDFDDAYDDWRSLRGDLVQDDVSHGLCIKLKDKPSYAFVLPVPDNKVREQVWDENHPLEKALRDRKMAIEHLFWGADGMDRYFKEDRNGKIVFKSKKVDFADNVISGLDSEHFEVFRPMFEFIESKCQAEDTNAA